MMLVRTMGAAAIAAAVAVSPLGLAPARADVIGVDARCGFDADSTLGAGRDYEDFRAHLRGLGHTLVPLTSFTGDDLEGLDAVITSTPFEVNQLFTDLEIRALHTFVREGGGHLIHTDGGGFSHLYVANINRLLELYGVVAGTEIMSFGGSIVADFNEHPVTAGVSEFGVTYQPPFVRIAEPAEDLTIAGGEFDLLAVVSGRDGSGHVVMLSDTSCWLDEEAISFSYSIDDLDNRVLLTNIIDEILSGAGVGVSLAMSGSCPGRVQFDLIGANPGAVVALVWGTGAGPLTIPPGAVCAGTTLEVGGPDLGVSFSKADATGAARFVRLLPTAACGRLRVQAIDCSICEVSNVLQP